MGELNISINDLVSCDVCGANQPMIFQDKKYKWSIACSKKVTCGKETKKFDELLDAAAEWGLAE